MRGVAAPNSQSLAGRRADKCVVADSYTNGGVHYHPGSHPGAYNQAQEDGTPNTILVMVMFFWVVVSLGVVKMGYCKCLGCTNML